MCCIDWWVWKRQWMKCGRPKHIRSAWGFSCNCGLEMLHENTLDIQYMMCRTCFSWTKVLSLQQNADPGKSDGISKGFFCHTEEWESISKGWSLSRLKSVDLSQNTGNRAGENYPNPRWPWLSQWGLSHLHAQVAWMRSAAAWPHKGLWETWSPFVCHSQRFW